MREFLKAVLPPRVLCALRALRNGPPATPVEEPLPGMTQREEQAFYTECAASLRDTPGAIVDLGCWMGSTSIALAHGLGSSSSSTIYAFDRFIWQEWMDHDGPKVMCDYAPGDCFLPEVRRRTRAYRNRITLVQADLAQYAWAGGAIKLLLVDAMKNPVLAQSIARSFYPHLQPGAVLIHQDFKHYHTSWIHILQYRLRSYFRFLRNVPTGGTVAFAATERIPAPMLEHATDFTSIDDREADAAFDYSLRLVSDAGLPKVAAAHIMHFVHRKEAARALERVSRYRDPAWRTDYDFGRALEHAHTLATSHPLTAAATAPPSAMSP